MTYIEVLLLIQERGEKIASDKTHAIHTDKFLYARVPDGTWEQKELPAPIVTEDKFPPLPVAPPKETKKKK